MCHVKRECRLWKREHANEKDDGQKNDKENTIAVVDGDIGIIYDYSSINLTCHTCDWVIDSGASLYITAHRDYFTSYINGDYGHVWMGNEGASKIVGMRDICLEANVGCKLFLKNVIYVPDIHFNLISTKKLNDDG